MIKAILRTSFACLLTLSGLTACDQFARNDQLTVQQQSNEVAVSNLNLGLAYLQQGEYEKSLDRLNRALEADPSYTLTYNALGLLHQRLGKNEDAEQYYKKALSINANDPHTLNNYGQFLCATGHYDEAQELFSKSAANPLFESPEIALTNAGTCAMNHGHPDVAASFFREALGKNPHVPAALLQMAQLSFNNGNYPDARDYLQRYLQVNKHTAVSLWLGIQ
ncbi:MAG: type IV pilus biogenesis/stability protein PilW, partial [Gammaproteobacteria bacterium]